MNKSTIEIMRSYMERTATTDSGAEGKAFEVALRSYISRRETKQVKAQGKVDIRATAEGVRYTCEIKSACGEIETADKCQLILYAPVVDISTPAENQAYVFTREQWREFLNGYEGRGKFLREDSKRGHLHIQSFYVSETIRPKASKPIARYIREVCEALPTVEEFFAR